MASWTWPPDGWNLRARGRCRRCGPPGKGSRYERRSVLLAPGDTLVLASDGFVEARSPRGQVLGYDGFLAAVARHIEGDPSACLEGIFNDVQQFSGGAEEQDDRTLVVIRHHAAALS